MPIEHERKYVLNLDQNFEELLKTKLKEFNGSIHQIQQAYIGKEGRIRKKIETHYNGSLTSKHHTDADTNNYVSLVFTYKLKLSKRSGSLELEMNMSEDDFNLAWSEEKKRLFRKNKSNP